MSDPQERLVVIRKAIEDEDISYGEIAELQGLVEHIDPTDVVLLEWAGVPEFPEDEPELPSHGPLACSLHPLTVACTLAAEYR